MDMTDDSPRLPRTVIRTGAGAAVVIAALTMMSPSQAATLGHSRVVSKAGGALAIDVQLRDVTAADRSSLTVGLAPRQAWAQAGLTPPVALGGLRVAVASGPNATTSTIQIRSDERFSGSVADVLLDVGTSSGVQRHQVSVLAPSADQVRSPASSAANAGSLSGTQAGVGSGSHSDSVAVRRGDTLFALSRRHVPPGVSIYQWMIAVHNANPQAFIRGDINLVKAGATLSIPDTAAMTAISDRRARGLFHGMTSGVRSGNAQAFDSFSETGDTGAGKLSSGVPASDAQPEGSRDQLRLSVAGSQTAAGSMRDVLTDTDRSGETGSGTGALGASTSGSANQSATGSEAGPGGASSGRADRGADHALSDDERAVRKNLEEAGQRVSQLEANIKNLNQAMQAQGLAATALVEDSANEISQTLSEASQALAEASVGANAILAIPEPGAPDAKMNKVESTVSWLQDNVLAIVTIILALLVLILAWALRRASSARSQGRDGAGGAITEAMVQEKLDQINLDLAAEDESAGRASKS